MTEYRALANSGRVIERSANVLSSAAQAVLGNGAADDRSLSRAPSLDPEITNADVIARFIVGEMINNTSDQSTDFQRIKANLTPIPFDTPDYESLYAARLFAAMLIFKSLVGYGQPWDHKKFIVSRWGKLARLTASLIEYDVWSNIHFGYVGLQAGFDADVLLNCAGIAQAISSDVPEGWFRRFYRGDKSVFAALDDPRDQEAIKIGIEVSRKFGSSLTQDQFGGYLRANLARVAWSAP
ncbi:hypothetical protein HJB88_27165 [Rhizobium sp. NZLR5]|uniref:polymorphic toxin type 44 domain-containing protein n=1 Tax=Rhizobium sp. NZLR5 TaxID=2731103 RepID=UPI001C8375F4|nr:polymorphic toxin type 44 domain-containing protein [Rhizobium sp. NZLR5]MBX5186265.1 hypothetical protein [Rhizobium sp. NZLR5]